MSLDSDPIDQAFPQAGSPEVPLVGDPIDHAFAEKAEAPIADVSDPEGEAARALGRGSRQLVGGVVEPILSGITGGAGNLADAVTGSDPGAHKWGYVPRTEAGKAVQGTIGDVTSAAGRAAYEDLIGPAVKAWGGDPEAARRTLAERVPEAMGAVGTVLGPAALVKGFPRAAPVGTPADIVARSSQGQSMGAAAASPNITAISPELQQAVVEAARKTGGAVNPDVLKAHIEAEEHGVQLMKGQATRNPEQFTAEQNSTHPDITARLNTQNTQLTDALDTIRRDASPTTVGNDYIENGRSAVDALKAYDEPIQADIRAKYKALTDANGGNVPIDTGKFLTNVDASLKKGFLTKTAASTPEISEILDSVRSGEPMDFEGFENARTRLAAAQRAGGSVGEAARIVRGQLEQMPLSPQAAGLKGLADTARSAAKARFDQLDADPAYQAAVDDVSAGNAKGSPSPLADTFLDKYALSKSAPKSQVDLMMQKIRATDPDAAGAVASHTLNTLRTAAVKPNGNIVPSGFNGALQKLGPKLDSLIAPETRDSLESFGRTLTNAKAEPAGGKVNYSRSGVVVRDALTGAAEGFANAKSGGLYGIVKGLVPKDKAFAREALKPGAGLDQLNASPP